MTRTAAIKKFFELDNGRKVENSDLLKFKKEDPKGYEEVGNLALEALGEELTEK